MDKVMFFATFCVILIIFGLGIFMANNFHSIFEKCQLINWTGNITSDNGVEYNCHEIKNIEYTT